MVQLRDKELGTRALVALGEEMSRLLRPQGVLLVVTDRVDVALAVGADGVHVGDEDMPVALARRLLGPQAIIGVSVATPEQAQAAAREGASYVSASAVFPTPSKADAGEPIGLAAVRAIRAAVGLPLLAIGGITVHNVGEVIAAGADGVAVISAVTEAEDMAQATAALRQAVREARRRRDAGVNA